ncbi:hypothetical protein EC973_000945 [Apophysomyces ossiformis]|uniref:rRNA-processing protein EFG1 n=1 Tax=Apophysomyces ossiformis TaxID=679940 RepID=A0A8H7BII3_9FUNG|nr:hypothetical protein EC973_000945 [Apophysomyces ossiformis]
MKQQPGNKPKRQQNLEHDKGDSLGKIKKRLRDTKRALNKGTISAAARISYERRLKALEFELGEKMIDAKEQKMKQKYHKVKHFEKNKVQRKLKAAKKKVEEAKTEEQKQKAEEEAKNLNIDLMYILHYPPTKPYVSLFPKENADDTNNLKVREEVRGKIKEILDHSGDMEDLRKWYRAQYRKALVRAGEIPEVKPLLEEDRMEEATPAQEDQEQPSASGIQDDFFE